MKKKLLFVESNTTGTGMILLKKAGLWNYTPVFLTRNPKIYEGLAQIDCEIIQCNTNSVSELQNIIHDSFSIDEIAGIMTTSEYYLTIVSELIEGLGLPGNSPEAMMNCRYKHRTRLILKEADILQPWFKILKSLDEIEAAANEICFPCVVKPVDESGSNHVRLCQTIEEVKAQAQRILRIKTNPRGQNTARAVLVEEYLEGQEYSVEMYTWEGNSQCIGITEKRVKGSPYFVEYEHIFPAGLSSMVQGELENTVASALKAVRFVMGVTHTEVKVTEKGCIIVEINARPAGGMIPELIRRVKNVDLMELHTKAMLGKFSVPLMTSSGFAGIHFIVADQSGFINEVNGVSQVEKLEGIKYIHLTTKPGNEVHIPANASHRLGFIIAQMDTYEETEAKLEEAIKLISFKINPSKVVTT
ncbi:ATP-grasp domain-containing protein [Fictibacillus fluitans]|uniref:ATP-grasp domain-containing protein n=1 Tax=Fictibacillus fluitans TaxID=3058422 RepID=A0ABT8HTK0_9BACL|nr:ATP-grasp domain-containing protein [Fictibacillus sp. NE201]MDN4524100.1 ATP-grasp domain-containing protein [Fictibacillus sp. NE201]